MDDSDLDRLADQALKWQKVLIENFAKIATLEQEKRELKKLKDDADQQTKSCKADVSKLLDQISCLEKIIAERSDFQAENRDLKTKIAELMKNFDNELEEAKKANKELEEKMKIRETEFETILGEKEIKLRNEVEEEKVKFELKMEEKCAELAELHQTMCQQEADHDSEMNKLKKEYEDRVTKLKEESTNLQNSASYNACKDIFRKKWDTAKARYESEIASLRAEITNLSRKARPPARTTPTRGRGRQFEFQPTRSSTPTGPPCKRPK